MERYPLAARRRMSLAVQIAARISPRCGIVRARNGLELNRALR